MVTEFESKIRDNLMPEDHVPPSSAGDMFGAQFSEAVRWSTPVTSQWFQDTEAHIEASRTVYSALQSGQIDKSLVAQYNMFGKIDYEGLLDDMNEQGISTTINREEFVEARNKQMLEEQADRQRVIDNPDSWWAKAAGFGGMLLGGSADPIYALTAPLGIGLSSTITQAVVKGAALNGAIELFAGLGTWDFNEEHGGKYGMRDYIEQVGGAALVGGVLTGGGKAIANVFESKVGKGYAKMFANEADKNKFMKDGDTPKTVEAASRMSKPEDLGATDIDTLNKNTANDDLNYQKGETIVGPGQTSDEIIAPQQKQVADVEQGPGFADPVQVADEVDFQASQVDMDRLDELQAKELDGPLDEMEADELELLYGKIEEVADVEQTAAPANEPTPTPEGGSQALDEAPAAPIDYGNLHENSPSVVEVRNLDSRKAAVVKAFREGECAI